MDLVKAETCRFLGPQDGSEEILLAFLTRHTSVAIVSGYHISDC
jgi:hypothetical protein